MSSGNFAKEELMEDYLKSLLNETPAKELEQETLSKLLEPVVAADAEVAEPAAEPKIAEQVDVAQQPKEQSATAHVRDSDFQALFFEVEGLKLAVPLTELGGIHQIDKIGPLFGKPDWFMGLMLHRDEKYRVVDTAKWVMPEKYAEKLAESPNYQYLIMLEDSGWGLACDRVVTTETLQPEDVKWREADAKRPWLGGMVKEKMCALVNVAQLVAMLDQGYGSNDK